MPQADRLVIPAPATTHLRAERRRRIRHKVHSPAYATTDQASDSLLPHLNEIVDISESGLCFQNPSQMKADERLELDLDLSETKAHINATATVVWSDPGGRTGLRFDALPEQSLHTLREWLFANILIACANQAANAASAELVTESSVTQSVLPQVEASVEADAPLLPDHTSILAAIAAIKKEVEALGVDSDAVLQLIAQRAQALTRGSGAAIALSGGEAMICRASAGSDAPGVGARLQIGEGFSGECVRTGELLYCEDSESDARVDRESCRALGVRSMVATPIRADGAVVGLLEVFAKSAGAFTDTDRLAVQSLAQIASRSVEDAIHALAATPAFDSMDRENTAEAATGEAPDSHWTRRILLFAIVLMTLALLGVILIPRLGGWRQHAAPVAKTSELGSGGTPTVLLGLNGIRQRAEQGDATAEYDLGLHYAIGDEVRLDQVEATRWFSLAADQGHVPAQSTMATHYWGGIGVPKDAKKAYFWAILARAQGDETSKVLVPELEGALTRSDILEVRQLADDWLKVHQLSNPGSSAP